MRSLALLALGVGIALLVMLLIPWLVRGAMWLFAGKGDIFLKPLEWYHRYIDRVERRR